jgi:hypothetical protein
LRCRWRDYSPASAFEADRWQTLYLFELGLALLCLGGVRLLALPPVERIKVFEPLDFVSFPLFATGMACSVRCLAWGGPCGGSTRRGSRPR